MVGSDLFRGKQVEELLAFVILLALEDQGDAILVAAHDY